MHERTVSANNWAIRRRCSESDMANTCTTSFAQNSLNVSGLQQKFFASPNKLGAMRH